MVKNVGFIPLVLQTPEQEIPHFDKTSLLLLTIGAM